MKSKLSIVLLSLIGLTAIVPVQAHAFDGVFLAGRDAERYDRREVRMERRAKRPEALEQQAEPARSEQEYGAERGYGYGYERRHVERNINRNDGRGRRE